MLKFTINSILLKKQNIIYMIDSKSKYKIKLNKIILEKQS